MDERSLECIDLNGVNAAEILIREDADAFWINVDGICRLRVQGVKQIIINDNSPKMIIQPMALFSTPKDADEIQAQVKKYPKDMQIHMFTIMYMTWNYLASKVNRGKNGAVKGGEVSIQTKAEGSVEVQRSPAEMDGVDPQRGQERG